MLSTKEIEEFKSKGYVVIRNFINQDEIKELSSSFQKSKKSKEDEEAYNVIDDEKIWKLLCNTKLNQIFNFLIGPNVKYLHDVDLLHSDISYKYTWHRDNPCRRTGIGPDWIEDPRYNVVSAAVYFSDSKESNSALNVIPGSHFKNYKNTLSNLLRVIHNKTRNSNNLHVLRNFLEKIIGKEIKYKAGDLIIFYCSLYHTGSTVIKNRKNAYREAIITRFGGEGIHSNNFLNYELNYRKKKQNIELSKKKDIFFEKLKQQNIFVSPDIHMNKIEGIHIPKNQSSDGISKN